MAKNEMNKDKFQKKYDPKGFEERIYNYWEKEWKFKPVENKTWDKFYIPMPPPNVTGKLHLGHSIFIALQDIMTRYHRMKWDSTLRLPWVDHAGISTQTVVEKKLALEWKTKFDLWREKFLQEAWDWKEEYGNVITSQIRKMWASCDWSKERFTLDDGLNKRVNAAFVDLYNKGLIYKWEYMVNYSPALHTVLSDQEVVYKEEPGHLYYITYFVSGSDNEVVVATTRPETMLWDVAVAVHPKDKRYRKILKAGKKLILPIVNKEIPLVADEMVDMEFGTWAVKITPAHDPNDFEVAKRHDLPLDMVVLWKDGRMTKVAWIFEWQDFMTARKNIVALLKSKWNLLKTEDHVSKVGYCERTWCKVETIVSKQWFVDVKPIAKKVIKWYRSKDFEIIPKRFNKIFEDWIFNLRDWCISRQLWWGHQIPVYYHNETGEMLVTEENMSNNKDYTRDPDVLDTWFSSALWPFSTLDYDMWGGEQPDLFEKFYPAEMLETGHDIIFFWVIRMLLFWYEFTDQTPFKTIYLHGLIKDKFGRKMSKSLWNGIDPLEMIEKYGTDALRLTLTIWNTPWNDLKLDEQNIENNKMFMNKIWNASRFVHMSIWDLKDITPSNSPLNKGEDMVSVLESKLVKNYKDLMFHEKWILSRLNYLSELVTNSMEDYTFSEAGQELYTFTKNEFCDYYIEEFKLTKETSKFGKEVIVYVLNSLLKFWHPYIPFITEEIYDKLWFEWSLISSTWPNVRVPRDKWIERDKELIISLIKEVRKLRADNNVMPNKTIKLSIYAKNKNAEVIEGVLDIISWIVKSEDTKIVWKKITDSNVAYGIIKSWIEVYVDTSNALDVEKEVARLKEQIRDTKEYIEIIDKKLLNENFITKAPKQLVVAEMEKAKQARDKLAKLEEKIGKFI